MKQFISWRRVSTQKQGRSGLGLEAQQSMIDYFVKAEQGELIADYAEVYTGKDLQGCTELQKAIKHCKEIGATLIIAKTDRFRNTQEALQVYEEMDGNIYFCDLPHTDKFTLTLFWAIAEREALIVSIRTKQALQAKKDRGETWERNTDTTKAREVMLKNKRQKALSNQSNMFLWNYLQAHERKCGKLTVNTPNEVWGALVEELNALGQTTATGLEYTRPRLRAAWDKIKNLYKYNN